MESVIFTFEELERLDKKQLIILAEYYGLSVKGKKNELIKRIFDKTNPHIIYGVVEDLGQRLLPDENKDNLKYSVKTRRIYWSEHMEDLK